MDLSLSDEEQTFRDEVRQFLSAKLTSTLRAAAASSPAFFVEPDIGLTWQAILLEQGWLAYQWPKEYGGTGWSSTQRYIFEKECALAGAPQINNVGLKLFAPVVYRFGSKKQKTTLLPRVLTGVDIWCQGFSEPQAGSDLASLQTRAIRDGDNYLVNGSKLWTTHAHHSNRMFCLVRTDAGAKRHAGISFLLIDMATPGVSVRPILTLGGDHEVNAVFFDNVLVPVDNRVGEEGQGWVIAKFLLENERGGSCFAPRLLSELDRMDAAALNGPDGYGGVLADDMQWRRRVARIRLSARALELLELRILADLAKGRPPGPQTSVTKLVASSLQQDIDLAWLDLFGAAGLEHTMQRPLYGQTAPKYVFSPEAQTAASRYLNNRAWTIFGGTSEIQVSILAKNVLNM